MNNKNVKFGNEYIYVYNKNNKEIKKIGEMSLNNNHIKLYDINLLDVNDSDMYQDQIDVSEQNLLSKYLEIDDDDSEDSYQETGRDCFLKYFNFFGLVRR